MAKKEFAVQQMTFKFVNPNHSGTVQVTGSPSTKVKKIPENRYCYKNNLSITIINGSDGSTTDSATGSGQMIATCVSNKCESVKPLRKGDKSGVITMTGKNRNPPPPTSTYTPQEEIDDSGQTTEIKCRGN